jgi:hypothetical protein
MIDIPRDAVLPMCRFTAGVCAVCGATASRDDVIRVCGNAVDASAGLRQPPPPCGPGCELKKTFAAMGFTDSDGCGCEEFAALMDSWGPAGCRDRLDKEIMPRLAKKAAERRLKFAAPLARVFVLRAIRRAERTAAAVTQ